ncbi:X-ray repair cross-complementing protein 6 [Rhizophlyctis rosea]|uniref:ATP-dependent DNA helicase II subunit 1 n=1 Tax=Rhizophlyctis rosea TaxID=64517 RepID=A0AAD5X9D1_9FUNG|nr:X-ray repair cross-complementing protein 6 [Rhizophlyctis rosea]
MSSYGNSWRSIEEDDEEEEIEENDYEGRVPEKDNVIFVIDASPLMHEVDKEGVSYFTAALKCASRFLQTKIVQSESDLMGLVFFGTEHAKNGMNFEHIYTLYDLDFPDVERILELERLEKAKSRFQRDIGTSEDYALSEVLWTCSNMFSAGSQKVSTKRIFLITCNDNPNANNAVLQRNANVRAKDLEDLGIVIELFPVQASPDNPFEISKFYQHLAAIPKQLDGDVDIAPASLKYQEMQNKILRKEAKKRTAFRVPFKIGEGLEISIKGYNLYVEQRKASYTRLLAKSNAEVKTVTSYVCSSSAQMLLPTDLKSYWLYGGQKVVFSKDEVAEIKHFGDPGLTLLGFKPKSALKFKHNIKHSAFIYPNEEDCTGSGSLFAHLLYRMIEKDKIAICKLIARRNTAPRLVALVPQKGFTTSTGEDEPSGFHVIFLPYADDIRHLADIRKPADPVPEEYLDLASEFIDKLEIKNYRVDNYENPVLQKHYANLQALALGKDHTEEIVGEAVDVILVLARAEGAEDPGFADKTLPKTEAMFKRTGAQIATFLEHIQNTVAEEVQTTKKRKAPASAANADDGDGAPKRAKKAAPALDAAKIKAKAEDGKLNSLTVAQMTEFLESVDVKAKKKKPELIKQIEDHFGL